MNPTPPHSGPRRALPDGFPTERLRTVAIIPLLVLAVMAVYAQTASFGFVNFDDEAMIVKNPAIRDGLTPDGIRWAFTTDQDAGWIPLTWLSRMLDVSLFGMNAGGHHLANGLFHLLNVLLLFRFLLRTTCRPWESGVVAALFAVHPVHVESVAWVTERKDVLAGFFWMLSLSAYARYAERPGIGRYLAFSACFALGLLSKPMVVTLPFVLLLLDWWPLRRVPAVGEAREPGIVPFVQASPGRLLVEKAPLFLLSAAASAVTVLSERKAGAMVDVLEAGIRQRFGIAAISYVDYLGMLLFPRGLAVFYPPSGTVPGPLKIGAAALVLVAVTALAVANARRRPWLPAGWFWFLGVLVPMIGLVPVGDFRVADRCLYLPAIGIYAAAVFGAAEAARKGRSRQTGAAVAATAILLALGTTAFLRTADWRDSGILFRRALSVTEDNWLAHGNLGHHLEREGLVDEAVRHYREALRIRPGYVDARVNLAVALQRQGKPDEAEAHFREAIRLFPADAPAHNNLGVILGKRGAYPEALAELIEAVRIRPDYAAARNNLGITLLDTGSLEEAEAQFREAVRIDPSLADAWNNLGVSLARRGRAAEAKPFFEEAVRRAPEHPGARANLGRYQAGQRDIPGSGKP